LLLDTCSSLNTLDGTWSHLHGYSALHKQLHNVPCTLALRHIRHSKEDLEKKKLGGACSESELPELEDKQEELGDNCHKE